MPVQPFGRAEAAYDALRVQSHQSIYPGPGDGSTTIGGGLENKIYLWHADGSSIDTFDPDSTGFDAALAVASSGDVIVLPAASISGNHTIALDVSVQGFRSESILTGQITVNGSLNNVTITGSLILDNVEAIVKETTVDHTGSGVNGVTINDGFLSYSNIVMRSAGSGDWGLYHTGSQDILHVTVNQVGGSNKGAYLDMPGASAYYCKFGGYVGAQVENALEIGWCWFNGSFSNGLQHTTTGTAYVHHCYFFGAGGADGLYPTATGLTIADCSWDSATNLSLVTIGPGDRASSVSPSDSDHRQVIINPHPGGTFDQAVARAIIDGKIYWSSHRGDTLTNGYEYTWDTLTSANAEIQSEAGKAGWQQVYNVSDGLIYVAGQVYADSITYRAAVWTIDPSTDTVTTHILNASGEATGDCNELIGILDDGTQLVIGERVGGGLTTGSDFPNGGGLWTIPKATIGTVSTYTRVYEDIASPTREWSSIVKLGSVYYALLTAYTNGKFVIQHSSNLTSWTVDIDGTALTTGNDIFNALIHHAGKSKLYAATVNGSHQVIFRSFDGATWTATTFANLTVPTSSLVVLTLAEFGGDVLLFVSKYNTHKHDVYLISNLDDAPNYTRLFADIDSVLGAGLAISIGPDVWYGVSNTGGLNTLHLWGQAAGVSDSGVTAGTYGDTTHVAQVTVDTQGRITDATDIAITFPAVGQYRQFTYTVSGGDFTFIIDGGGNPIMALQDLE